MLLLGRKFTLEIFGDEKLYHSLDIIADKLMIDERGFVNEKDINKSISRYFKGANDTAFSFNVKYKWKLVRVGEVYVTPDSALPLGSTRKVGCVEV